LAARWPIGLYQAVLLGANRAAAFSAINIAMSVTTALGVIAFLLWRADLRVVLAWQIGAALVLLGWLRHAAWQILGPRVAGPMDYSILRQQWKFSAAVAGINVIGLWFMQYDKLALSRLLPLALFSHYMIATLVVSTLYQLITPVFNVVYPRFTSLYARAEHEQLRQGYRLMTALVAAVVFPLAMWLMVWGEGLVRLWTGSADIAADVAPVVALLAAGSGLHAVMYVVYALQLGQGEEKLALKISLALLVVQAPLVWYLTVHWGGVGAAAAWLCLHIIYLLFGGWVTHRRLQPGLAWGWLCRDVGVPLLLCAAAGTIASLIQRAAGPQSWFAVLLGAGFAALLAFIGLLSSPSLRPRTLSLLSSLLRRWATP